MSGEINARNEPEELRLESIGARKHLYVEVGRLGELVVRTERKLGAVHGIVKYVGLSAKLKHYHWPGRRDGIDSWAAIT